MAKTAEELREEYLAKQVSDESERWKLGAEYAASICNVIEEDGTKHEMCFQWDQPSGHRFNGNHALSAINGPRKISYGVTSLPLSDGKKLDICLAQDELGNILPSHETILSLKASGKAINFVFDNKRTGRKECIMYHPNKGMTIIRNNPSCIPAAWEEIAKDNGIKLNEPTRQEAEQYNITIQDPSPTPAAQATKSVASKLPPDGQETLRNIKSVVDEVLSQGGNDPVNHPPPLEAKPTTRSR